MAATWRVFRGAVFCWRCQQERSREGCRAVRKTSRDGTPPEGYRLLQSCRSPHRGVTHSAGGYRYLSWTVPSAQIGQRQLRCLRDVFLHPATCLRYRAIMPRG